MSRYGLVLYSVLECTYDSGSKKRCVCLPNVKYEEMTMKFEDQLNEVRIPCIMEYFKDRNMLNFLKSYINIDCLFQSFHAKDTGTFSGKLMEIEKMTENALIIELINSIKVHLCVENPESSESNCKADNEDGILLIMLSQIFSMSEVCFVQKAIQIKQDDKPDILVYSKRVKEANASKKDVENFYHTMMGTNSCGILCSSGGIANKDSFEIDIPDNNVYIFVSNHNYDKNLFKVAVKIIYHIYDVIKDNKGIIEIDKELLQRLKLEYNYFLVLHTKHLTTIKNTVTSLEKLTLTQLDHFFKRTHISALDKPYSCQLCGTQFGTDKSLKSHLKLKHDIQLAKKKKPIDSNNYPDDGIIHFN